MIHLTMLETHDNFYLYNLPQEFSCLFHQLTWKKTDTWKPGSQYFGENQMKKINVIWEDFPKMQHCIKDDIK